MEIGEAIETLKRNLPQLGKYAFRLGPDCDSALREQMDHLRDRIEADLKRLLRMRSKTLLAIESERLWALVNTAIRSAQHLSPDEANDIVVEALRTDFPVSLQGNIHFIRARIFQLPDLPPTEYSAPVTEERIRGTREWIDDRISFADVSIFERLAFDRPDDAFLFDLAYREDGRSRPPERAVP